MRAILLAAALLMPLSAEAQVPCPVPEPGTLHIATFNVFRLGNLAKEYTDHIEDGIDTGVIPERVKNLARILAAGRFDLVAFQEVTDGAPGRRVMDDLVEVLASDHAMTYQYFLSDHIGRGLMPEAIAFLFNPDSVRPEIVARENSLAENIEIGGRDLVRTQWEAGSFDFTLISAHLAWGNEGDRDEGYQKIDQIFTAPRPSAFSIDDDIIVLGDFNRFGKGYDSVKELEFDGSFLAPNVTLFDPDFNERKDVRKSHIVGKGIPNDDPQWLSTTVAKNTFVYDMILLSPDVAEEYSGTADGSGFGTDWGILHFDEAGGCGLQADAETLGHNALKEAYSDHRPVWMRFRTDGDTADDGPGGILLSSYE